MAFTKQVLNTHSYNNFTSHLFEAVDTLKVYTEVNTEAEASFAYVDDGNQNTRYFKGIEKCDLCVSQQWVVITDSGGVTFGMLNHKWGIVGCIFYYDS